MNASKMPGARNRRVPITNCAPLAASALALSCAFTPDYDVDDCSIRCETSCPTGMECRDGYCVAREYAGSCEQHVPASRPEVAPGLDAASATTSAASPSEESQDANPSRDADCSVDCDTSANDDQPSARGPEITSAALLPEACAGEWYEYRFSATGGAGHYSWTDVATGNLPDWLSLSPDGSLTGVVPLDAAEEFAFMVRVASSALDNPVAREFTLPVLRTCKFAFLGERGNRVRLFLGDARRARTSDQFEAEDLTASVAGDQDVRAFEFSPNGQTLVFTLGHETDDTSRSLWVVGTNDVVGTTPLTEIVSESSDRIIQSFAWSTESDRLVILTHSPGEQKSLLHVASASPSWQAAREVGLAYPLPWSEVFRIGRHACYFTVNGERACIPFDAPESDASIFPVDSVPVLSNSNFVQWTTSGEFQAVFDKGAASDPFVLMLLRLADDQQSRSLDLYGIPDASMNTLVQPGDYTDPTVAHVFRLGEGPTFGGGSSPIATLQPCENVLALQRDAVACHNAGTLHIATLASDLSLSNEQLVMDGTLARATGLSRTFAYGSLRYIYDTFDGVMMVDLTQPLWSAEPLVAHDAFDTAAFDTAAFEELTDARVLIQVGTTLNVADLATSQLTSLSGGELLPAPPWCEESFALGGPYGWCGSSQQSKSFSSSETARAVVFTNHSGELFIANTATTSSAPSLASPVLVSDATVHCEVAHRENGRPEGLASGCEQELKWAPVGR